MSTTALLGAAGRLLRRAARRIEPGRARPLAFAALVLLAPVPATADDESLGALRERLAIAIDPAQIAASGVSSGGFMANQLHLAHASELIGVGLLAAGPYACASGSSFWCDWVPFWYGPWMEHDACLALHVCTAFARETFGWFAPYWGPPGHEPSVAAAVEEADAGTIDPLTHLAGDRVWVFAGAADELVPEAVAADLAAFYEALFAHIGANGQAGIHLETGLEVEHAMVIDDPAGPDDCLAEGPPFINDCSFDAAGALLTFVHDLRGADGGRPEPTTYGEWDRNALFAFDQRPFLVTHEPNLSLNSRGHLYVPQACRGGTPCPLHVALHGCRQHEQAVAETCGATGACPARLFFKDGGYNEWAEAHGLVVLYPQTTAWGTDLEADKNPRGCWDWWGYSGDDYFRQSGQQIRTLKHMIDCVAGTRPCP